WTKAALIAKRFSVARLPFVASKDVIILETDVIPNAFVHIHADPDGIYTFQVIEIPAGKISFLLS
ncbi:MAG: hypothetical protein LUG99_00025, partial [Lachnospiraceae bacterium]|nr:hypothetical protein [Lachnospiraceae bacterium]